MFRDSPQVNFFQKLSIFGVLYRIIVKEKNKAKGKLENLKAVKQDNMVNLSAAVLYNNKGKILFAKIIGPILRPNVITIKRRE